jgi:hypothetical protein
MLRLNPAHPPLWRDATTLQFGVDDVARLEDPQPWEELLITELSRGVPKAAIPGILQSRRIRPDQWDAFVAELQPALQRTPPLARVVVQRPIEVDAATVDAVAGALSRTGARVRVAEWIPFTDPGVFPGETVVVLAAHLVEPRRGAALMARDIRHLPLVFDGGGVTVGPLIEPGVTACLACDAAHARDADPAWPVVASQLVGRPCAVDPDLAIEAARAAAHLVSAETTTPSRSLRLRVDGPSRAWRVHPPHEECGCRSPAGTATDSAASERDLAPSSPTAFARPA